MLMIRFQRIGRTNDPAFRIVVLEKERAAKAGNIVELLGTYNPRSKALTLNDQRVKDWLKQGAQPTDSIHNLLVAKGVIEGKKINALPKKSPQKSEEAIAAEAAAAAAEKVAAAAPAAVIADVPVEPTEAEVAADAEPAEEEAPAAEATAPAPAAEETPAQP